MNFRRFHAAARRLNGSLALLLIAALLLGLLPGVSFGQAALAQAAPAQGDAEQGGSLPAGGFGPLLFLIATPAGGWPQDLPPTTVIHARIEEGDRTLFVASGSPADVTALGGSVSAAAVDGAGVQVLDENAAGSAGDAAGAAASEAAAYYLVDATAGPDAAAAVAAVTGAGGRVLWQGSALLLARTTLAGEQAFVERLGLAGVPVNLVSSAGLAQPSAEAALEDAAVAAPLARDPVVDSLLPQITETGLRDLVDGLSGQKAVVVGGAAVTINTRYTFAARLRDAERYVYEYYQALGIPVSYVPWSYGSYSGRNVVAEVRGAVTPEKILLVGGHLDNTSQIPYTTAPGADDNGTGTASTLLIAKLLKNYRPDFTVRFVHFTAEEQGHWGSIVYAGQMRARGEQVIGYFDLDMIGWDGNGDRVVEIHTASGPKSNALATSFLERNTRYALGLNFERKTTTASRFSDHSSFWDQDYAAFLIIENFFDDAIVRDRNPWYHNTGDLPSRVDFNYVARIARLALAATYELGGYHPAGAPTPVPTATATATPTATPDPNGCTNNLLLNGDFETTGSWSFGSTPYPAAYVTSPVYSGLRAVRQGIPRGVTNVRAHSSTYQRVTIPADAPAPVLLRFMRRAGGSADGVDYREALLLNSSLGYLATLERSYAAGDETWTERRYDLTAYRGRTLYVYFNVYNDGAGQQMWTNIDRVILGSCTSASAAFDESGRPLPAPYLEEALRGWQLFLPDVRN